MRVIMINRPSALSIYGGDTTQMLKTKEYLQRVGVEVDICLEYPPSLSGERYDLVHVFNLQTASYTLDQVKWAKRYEYPVVLSPIFWKFEERGWREDTLRYDRRFHLISQELGSSRARFYLEHELLRDRRAQLRILNLVDWILPNARSELHILEDTFHLELEQKMTIVPNGVDASVFHPDRASPDEAVGELGMCNYILECARIEPCKGQLALLEALGETIWTVVFVGGIGNRRYYQECQDYARNRGNVFFLGAVPHKDLPQFYAAAKAHTLPSYRETPGLASLEAGAMGCNIVTTMVGSAHEYFGDDAWYCDPEDIGSIKSALCAAHSAPKSDNLQKRILKRYTWEEAARQTRRAYEEALSRT